MRLLERFIDDILGGRNSEMAKHCVPVDVNNVAQWYFTESDVDEFSLRDQFPSVVAPFPITFFEYRVPAQWKLKGEDGKWEMVTVDEIGDGRIGVLILQERLPDDFSGRDMQEGNNISQVRSNLKTDPGPPRFRQFMTIFAGNRDTITVACSATNYVDNNGLMMGGPMHEADPKIIERYKHRTEVEAYSEFVRVYGFPVFFSTSILTCKNVSMIEQKASPDQIKKAMKRGTRAFSYRNIVVESMRKSILSGEHGGGHSVMTALRIGRGHWKDYTQGAGLFGKLKGRFWWDSYITGDDKQVDDIRRAGVGQARSYTVRK